MYSPQQSSNTHLSFHSANKKFSIGFRWSLVGSIFFEASQLLHNSFILYLFGSSFYGLLGSLFSITYLVINLANLGFDSSFVTFLHIVTTSKTSFRRVFPIYILPQIFILLIASFFIFLFYKPIFNNPDQPIPTFFFIILVLSEGIRIFFRRFLHNVFLNKSTVLIEHALSFIYYSIVWLPIFFGTRLTLPLIFIPYLLTSLAALLAFIIMTILFYNRLPSSGPPIPSNLWPRILKTRYYNSLINIESFIISGNFLVPFFATTFGLHQAGLFKIVTIISHSIKAIAKSVIHFPGNALLSSLKSSPSLQLQAFRRLFTSLNHIIIFFAIFFTTNFATIIRLSSHPNLIGPTSIHMFIFVGITLVHQLFIVYEQFYIIEELSRKLFIIKSIEFILFYFLILANNSLTPTLTLINIAIIQLVSFSILSIHAYSHFKLKPVFGVKLPFIILSFLISLVFYITSCFILAG